MVVPGCFLYIQNKQFTYWEKMCLAPAFSESLLKIVAAGDRNKTATKEFIGALVDC
jgi:hypothetical protein